MRKPGIAAAALLLALAACGSRLRAGLSDAEFWSLGERFSERPGTFALSDNYLSNEAHFAETVRRLFSARLKACGHSTSQ